MVFFAVFGCSEPLPDAFSTAFSACEPENDVFLGEIQPKPAENCLEIIKNDLGDPSGRVSEAVFSLFLWGSDPYFYDLIAAKIDHISPNDFVAGPAGEYDQPSKTAYFRADVADRGIIGASVVVHEAAHGLSTDHGHVLCPDGLKQCDKTLKGSVGTQLMFLGSLLPADDDAYQEEIDAMIAETWNRLL